GERPGEQRLQRARGEAERRRGRTETRWISGEARRHRQQLAERHPANAPVGGMGELDRKEGLEGLVDAADPAVGDRDPERSGGHALRDRKEGERRPPTVAVS